MEMNPVVHFEIPTEDRERAAKFYRETFGWDIKQLGEEMGYYMTADTSESDEKGPKKPGVINGGLYEKTADMLEMHPSFVISVSNIEEHMKKVTEAGGKIIDEPMDIPGVGRFVSFIDTEGNRLSILQALEM